MNGYLFIAAFSMLLGGIFSIATSSIAVECYNKNESLKKEKQTNFNFVVSNLVCAIILIIVGCISIYFAFSPTEKIVSAGEKLGLSQIVLSPSSLAENQAKMLQEGQEAAIAQYMTQVQKQQAFNKLQQLLQNTPGSNQLLNTLR